MSPELLAFFQEHALASLSLVGLTIAILYNEATARLSGVKAVAPAGLTALINREDALLVDLSAPAEFEKGHIAGARNVLPSQFDADNKVLAKVRDLPVVVACRTGQASSGAARKLAKAGFKQVYWLDGGVAAWQQANLPLVRGRG